MMGADRSSWRRRLRGAEVKVCAVLALALLPLLGPAAAAQAPAPERASVAELEELVATIENEAERERLLGQLRALIEAQRDAAEARPRPSGGAEALRKLAERTQSMGRNIFGAFAALEQLPGALAGFVTGLADAEKRAFWIGLLWKLALVLGAGWLAELVVRRLCARAKRRFERARNSTFWSRLVLQLARLLLDAFAIVAFALAAYAVLSLTNPQEITRLVALALVNASIIARAIMALARVVLSPQVAALRPIPAGDETANYWWVWVRRITGFGVYGYFIIETALLLGLEPALHDFLLNLFGIGLTAMLVVLVQQNRAEVSKLIAGDAAGTGAIAVVRRQVARLWNVLALAFLIAVYGVWVADLPGGFTLIVRASVLTVLIVAAGMLASIGLKRTIHRGFHLSDELRARYPMLEQRANRYVPALESASGYLVALVAVLVICQAWTLDVLGWLSAEDGRAFVAQILTIVFVLAAALVVWEVASAVMEHFIDRPDEAGERHARLRTLLPLARKTLAVVMSVMVVLTVLSELGVDIGPLLAGAGVVGLAVGFGAQTLVKDIITGIFILIEDTLSVGDYVEAGGHGGTVESMSIRTIQMRDLEGNIHTVPFSEVTTVKNYTRDFGYALMDIGVAYREDVDEVIEVLKELGEEAYNDPELGANFIEPMTVMGLQAFGDSAVVIRARVKTVAGTQWATRRELYKRIKRRFDERGIEIPFPHHTVYFGVDKSGGAPPAQVRLNQTSPGGDGRSE